MSNDTETLTLTDFLLARIREDEELLEREDRVYGGGGEVWTIDAHNRVRAECEAKRHIAEGLRRAETHVAEVGGRHEALYGLRSAARSLATVYADHPEYREEWRP